MTDELDKLAREILNRHCEYMDGLDRGQCYTSTNTAQEAVKEAIQLGEQRGMKLQRERDAVIARDYCLVPPDGGEPDALERDIGAAIAQSIRTQP